MQIRSIGRSPAVPSVREMDSSERTGPFWDGLDGRSPMPPAAATLGLELVGADTDAGTIDLTFDATAAFTNPLGNVLGGFLAAMLYDTVGPALLATVEPCHFQSTAALTCHFHRSVRPGRLRTHGRVVHRVGSLAHVEASLWAARDPSVGLPAATALAICRIIPWGEVAA